MTYRTPETVSDVKRNAKRDVESLIPPGHGSHSATDIEFHKANMQALAVLNATIAENSFYLRELIKIHNDRTRMGR